jgi:hypothetical protein
MRVDSDRKAKDGDLWVMTRVVLPFQPTDGWNPMESNSVLFSEDVEAEDA